MKALVSTLAVLCASNAAACVPPNDAQSLIGEGSTSLTGYLSIEVGVLSVPFDMELMFCGDVAKIERVEVAAIMPAHQHGMNYEPTVMPGADGHFEVSGMLFHMPGVWQVQVSVYGLEEPSFFNLEVEAR